MLQGEKSLERRAEPEEISVRKDEGDIVRTVKRADEVGWHRERDGPKRVGAS